MPINYPCFPNPMKFASPPQRHLNSYIHSIITHLKQYTTPITFSSINTTLNINLYQNPIILTALRKNPKIIVNTDTLQFKPTYYIEKKEDIKQSLIDEKLNNVYSIEVSELKDCPVDIDKFVSELLSENMIYTLKDIDGTVVVYDNDMRMDCAKDIVKEMWNKIKVPEYQDVRSELKRAGLKSGSEEKRKAVIKEVRKKPKRYNRRVKITNTHVKDLDLDFSKQ